MLKKSFAEKAFEGTIYFLYIASFPIRALYTIWDFFTHCLPKIIHDWKFFRRIQDNPEEYKKLDWDQKAEFLGWLLRMRTKQYLPEHIKVQIKKLEDEVFNVQKWAQDTFK